MKLIKANQFAYEQHPEVHRDALDTALWLFRCENPDVMQKQGTAFYFAPEHRKAVSEFLSSPELIKKATGIIINQKRKKAAMNEVMTTTAAATTTTAAASVQTTKKASVRQMIRFGTSQGNVELTLEEAPMVYHQMAAEIEEKEAEIARLTRLANSSAAQNASKAASGGNVVPMVARKPRSRDDVVAELADLLVKDPSLYIGVKNTSQSLRLIADAANKAGIKSVYHCQFNRNNLNSYKDDLAAEMARRRKSLTNKPRVRLNPVTKKVA